MAAKKSSRSLEEVRVLAIVYTKWTGKVQARVKRLLVYYDLLHPVAILLLGVLFYLLHC